MMKGAEAVVTRSTFLGKKIVIKERIAKSYRAPELDLALRKTRTRIEARLLHKAKQSSIRCPTVLCVTHFSLYLSFINGKRPVMDGKNAQKAGEILAQLHDSGIIHGDYTPANLISGKELYLIDFGLGFFSNDVEDKAVDVLTMKNALERESIKNAFLEGYKRSKKHEEVMKRITVVESRVRYF